MLAEMEWFVGATRKWLAREGQWGAAVEAEVCQIGTVGRPVREGVYSRGYGVQVAGKSEWAGVFVFPARRGRKVNVLIPAPGLWVLGHPVLHEFRQLAVVADGVRVVAEIPHHLQQALLRGGPGQGARGGAAQQSLPGQAQG